MKKIFVTGVAGMIGSNFARKLVYNGFNVIGVDNLWRGKIDNISDLLEESNFEFRHADITFDQDWYVDLGVKDDLIHIADIVAGIGYVFSNEWSIYQKNQLINTAVARVVNKMQPNKLIYLGTACSYPQGLQRSVTKSMLKESDKYPADPESGYGWSKLMGEIEFKLATKNLATKLIVLDLHNVYGWPCVYKDSTSQVIPSLINKAITSTDGAITVWGDGNQGRAFVHVSDVVEAILLAMNYEGTYSNFMIGPNFCTSIKSVVQILLNNKKLGLKNVIYDASKPTGDIGRFSEGSLAAKELGWNPRVNVDEGINALIDEILAHHG